MERHSCEIWKIKITILRELLVNNSDFEKLLLEQELTFQRHLNEQASKLTRQIYERFDDDMRFQYVASTIYRKIEFSNITLTTSRFARLSQIPKVGEYVNGHKVTDLEYDIDGQINKVMLELESELKTNQHLTFEDFQTYLNVGNNQLGGISKKSDRESYRSLFIEKSIFHDEKKISEDQFNEWFPHIKPLDEAKELEPPKRKGFWKLFR